MNNNAAIITGAGSGIGGAVAVQLGAAGYRLALVGRTRQKLQETASALSRNSEALIIEADLADRNAPQRIAHETLQTFGRVDALINNAAVAPVAPLAECNWAELERTFASNMFGPACLIAALWPTFTRQNGARIVNVSSMSAIDPFAGLSIYAASKSALESLARSIKVEGAPHNIKAFNIAPGAVETQMLRTIVDERSLPRDRTLTPETVASLIVACATGKRDNQNGTTIALPSP